MGFGRPTGPHANEMLEPGGWPNSDEHQLLDRVTELSSVLQKLTQRSDLWLREKAEISSGSIWSGEGANAGCGAISRSASTMGDQQDRLLRAITWLNHAFNLV